MRTKKDTASASVRIDKRRAIAGSTSYPVRLFVYNKGIAKSYSTSVQCTEEEWKTMQGEALNLKDAHLKKMSKQILIVKTKADDIIDKILKDDFSFASFEELFLEPESKKARLNVKLKEELNQQIIADQKSVEQAQDVYAAMKQHMIEMKAQGRSFGAIQVHKTALSTLQNYRAELKFSEITPKFLYDFETYLTNGRERKVKLSTVGIRMREIRIIVNDAIEAGVFPKEKYPFGPKAKRKYEIPEAEDNPRALENEDLRRLLDYIPQTQAQAEGKDYWIFTLLCNGINMRDICALRYRDIEGQFLVFRRKKVSRKRKQGRPIEVFITEAIQNIILRRGSTDRSPDNYIFPVMQQNVTDDQNYKLVSRHTWNVNNAMKRIGKKLGIDIKITTYVARHSWATGLQQEGVPESFISKGLGHSSVAITQKYLGGFKRAQKMIAAEILLKSIYNPTTLANVKQPLLIKE